jgi:hypothetical protein
MQRHVEIGVLGIAVPQEYGGSGLGILGSEIRIRSYFLSVSSRRAQQRTFDRVGVHQSPL